MTLALLIAIFVLVFVGTIRDIRNHTALKRWIVLAATNPEAARKKLLGPPPERD